MIYELVLIEGEKETVLTTYNFEPTKKVLEGDLKRQIYYMGRVFRKVEGNKVFFMGNPKEDWEDMEGTYELRAIQ